jgi:hypothetical protein
MVCMRFLNLALLKLNLTDYRIQLVWMRIWHVMPIELCQVSRSEVLAETTWNSTPAPHAVGH